MHFQGSLAEYYVLFTNNRIEQLEADIIKYHQQDLRATLPKDFIAALQRGLKEGETLGKVFLMKPTWKGSRRHMQQCYADAMAIIRETGQPHL